MQPHHLTIAPMARLAFCSVLSLSQAYRPVLGADLNRSESSWDASAGPRDQRDVRYTCDSYRAGASHWTHAMCESRTQSTAANELDGGNDAGVVRPSASAGVRLCRAYGALGCRNYRVISGELRPGGASTTTLSKSMSIFPSTIGLRDSISEGAYHGCFSTTPF